MSRSSYQGLRCPHCAGKLPGYVSRDAELARIRELTMRDAEVVRLQNQLASATAEPEDPRIGRAEYLREHGDEGDERHPGEDRYEKWLDGPPDMG
jgi:hypothetical protein